MRELKILFVVVAFTLITYFGVEPYAHSQMHPHVEAPDYAFKDVDGLKELKGDATNGATLVQTHCIACHAIEKVGFPKLMDDATSASSYGVVPPDLSTSGLIYDANYLAAFIKNPAKATKTEHKFVDGVIHPMPNYDWLQAQEIADMVVYLQSIAPKSVSNKEAYKDACQRCHAIKYGDMQKGSMVAFTPDENIKAYMGTLPPDLSQYIKSRSENYLHEFINNPQKHLEGSAMPRVGLTKAAEDQVIEYMIEVGDSSRNARNELGPKFLIYFLIFAVLAWLWKAKIWRDVH